MTNLHNNSISQVSEQQGIADDEIDLKELFIALWAGKLWIISTTFVASVIAIAVAISMPNIYRSEALLAPVSSESGGLGGLASQFGGLASLAGVSLPGGGGGDKTTLGLEVIKSRQFFSTFMEKYDVLLPLMAAENWDPITNTLVIDPEIYDVDNNIWVRDPKSQRKIEPSVQEAHEEFLEILSIAQDKETGFISLSVEHYSPYVAKKWVDKLVVEINETIRAQEVSQAERSISYLQEQIKGTQLAELQAGFFEMIQSQTETIMLANATPEYLFKTVDPAIVSELKAKPTRSLICIMGALLGFILGVFLVLTRYCISKVKTT